MATEPALPDSETPERCPTCGSPDPEGPNAWAPEPMSELSSLRPCPDPFHSDPLPIPSSDQEGERWTIYLNDTGDDFAHVPWEGYPNAVEVVPASLLDAAEKRAEEERREYYLALGFGNAGATAAEVLTEIKALSRNRSDTVNELADCQIALGLVESAHAAAEHSRDKALVQRDSLREGLEPFAAFADRLDGTWPDDEEPEMAGKPKWDDGEGINHGLTNDGPEITVADFRRARSLLHPPSEPDQECGCDGDEVHAGCPIHGGAMP